MSCCILIAVCLGFVGMLSGVLLGLSGSFWKMIIDYFTLYCTMKLTVCSYDSVYCSGSGICLYVDHLLAESTEEIRKLRGYMYSYKAN